MADLNEYIGEREELENLEELNELLTNLEKELNSTDISLLKQASSYGIWEQTHPASEYVQFEDEEDKKQIIIEKIKSLSGKNVYIPQFNEWFNIEVSGNNVVMKKGSNVIEVIPLQKFAEYFSDVEEIKVKEGGMLTIGDKVVSNDGKKGVIIKEVEGGKYLVQLDNPVKIGDTEVSFLVFASKELKRLSTKPGDIVRRKGEPATEYTVLEVDTATGKAKVKSKTTGEESVVDIEHIEPVTASRLVRGQEFPYRKPEIEFKEELPEEEEEIKEEEKPKERPREEVEKPEIEEEPTEVLLTETIKSIFLDPEVAVQIVEKLIDIITMKGLEREFIQSLGSKGLELDDLLCPSCYEENGIKIYEAFNEVLGSKSIRRIIGTIDTYVRSLIKRYKNKSDHFAILGSLPKCSFCYKEARFDARTVYGPWAYMCSEHFLTYGMGHLGTGFGQILVLPDEVKEYGIKKKVW
jgi:hypothetical protein